ncbi:TerD family protein [Myxococcota bacterium]|nr:TerD family protein [Myxococcota bacterium]MBU1430103.1 TerD family protein [Myxococcota bacterium]MBU1896839.1 TerD family protein [Myxococcota bacterium]
MILLTKGGNISLSKQSPGLKKVLVGLGWDERASDGQEFDLDACAFILNDQKRVRSVGDFVFYNQLTSADGAVQHLGDNRTGQGDGDDEQVTIDFSKMGADATRVAICVTIHEAEARRQNFGMVSNAFVRVVNAADGKELARYNLSEEMSSETAMVFAELYKYNNEWQFKAVGQGFAGGMLPLAKHYGVPL